MMTVVMKSIKRILSKYGVMLPFSVFVVREQLYGFTPLCSSGVIICNLEWP